MCDWLVICLNNVLHCSARLSDSIEALSVWQASSYETFPRITWNTWRWMSSVVFATVMMIIIIITAVCRFCYDDDLYTISSAYHSSCSTHQASVHQHPYHDVQINSLKHRLLVHLYQRSVAEATATGTPKPVLIFFRHFDEFRRLRMWKMQLLDENHVLIRYWCLVLIWNIESVIDWLIDWLIRSFVRSFNRWIPLFIQSFILSVSHPFSHLFIHSFSQSVSHSFSQLFSQLVSQSFIHSVCHSFIQSVIHSFSHSFNHSVS